MEIKSKEWVGILDFGSQYTQLIARRIRENNVYSQILPFNISSKKLLKMKPKALILSGGPATVTNNKSPFPNADIFNLNIPILGICYGLQVMAKFFKGNVKASFFREYGYGELSITKKSPLWTDINNDKITVWLSHGDSVDKLPPDFEIIGKTQNSISAIEHKKKKIYGVQFHPEVVHTSDGNQIIKNFLFEIAKCSPSWTMQSFIKTETEKIKNLVKNEKVICALSGGVDSSVLAVLLHKAIGSQLTCIFVDNGLLRLNEAKEVVETFKNNYHINLKHIKAEKSFLTRLENIIDPEKKRKIIGKEFIRIFEQESKKIGNVQFLAQGTLYPDVIESQSALGGPSITIKTHHNVGGLPKKMKLKLIEPFRELFKDEVREIGKELFLPDKIIKRHPFPGPGLAIRIIGKITKKRLNILKEVDKRYIDAIKETNLYDEIWQAFAVLLPIKTVGVMGDERTYENVIALRAVTSKDGMTANWFYFPNSVLAKISNCIINEVKGVNRVVYDISSKPPSTIEWE
ncbi:MAG: glutamine-hydrolyzing GMP synthase [bacterium]